MKDCLFCRIIAGDIPSTKVYEDDKVFAFRDINPQADNLGDVAACFAAVPQIAASEGLSEGYRIINNCGAAAGQTVMHLHFHLIGGRTLGEKII